MNDKHYNYEEEYHSKDRKYSRRERKIAVSKDRSKFKKSDQDQLKKRTVPTELPENHMRGRVLAIVPEGILVDADGQLVSCLLKGSLKQERNRMKNLVAVGDFVHFSLQSPKEGMISYIEDRRTVLSRADNLSRNKEQLIAVNIDQVLITASVVLPPLKPPLIDRYIIASQKGGMQPVILVNKIDLFDSPPHDVGAEELEVEKIIYAEFLDAYRKLDIPVIPISTATGAGIEELKQIMHGKASVFSGQSGVGKSSLINVVTGSDLRVGEIVERTRKGSHTTTTSLLLPVEGGGFCIDTPGIKSFGLWDLSKSEIQSYFSEIAALSNQCKYPDCSHVHEPGCAVKMAVDSGEISSLRFESYCALMADLSTEHRHR
jgi:ribosome biogenesis GTPase